MTMRMMLYAAQVEYEVIYFFICFFFQAEDGIRDFCLSRGLGDVLRDRTTRVSNLRLGA